MSVWNDIRRRGNGFDYKKEDDLSIEFDGSLNYSNEEKEYIKTPILELHKSRTILPFEESQSLQSLVREVFISAERKTYQVLFKERFPEDKDDDWEKLATVRVLGEYKSEEKKIILYINNIKEIEYRYGDLLPMMRYVYLHELMHAYFDRNPNHDYIYGIEEAFAEFGALLCIEELVSDDKANPAELEWALSHVNGKKDLLTCYSYGYNLFNQYKENKVLGKQMLKSYL